MYMAQQGNKVPIFLPPELRKTDLGEKSVRTLFWNYPASRSARSRLRIALFDFE
jgi:hypothetical protein